MRAILRSAFVEGASRCAVLAAVVTACTACGGVTPSNVGPTALPTPTPAPVPTPSPVPSPSRFLFTGRVTETMTGIPVAGATVTSAGVPVQSGSGGTFSFEGSFSSMRVTVAASGYLPRETTITAGHDVVVDVIHDAAPFSLVFYRQMARNAWEGGTPLPLRVLPAAPAFYLQTKGLTSENISTLAQATRSIVSAFTGGRFTVTTFETGVDARSERAGWVVIELANEPTARWCGRAFVGSAAGHIWMNTADGCLARGSLDEGVLHMKSVTRSGSGIWTSRTR
jgi:hypothetical protein